MLSINVTNNVDVLRTSQGLQSGLGDLNEYFYISLTDTLLNDTRQYEKWKAIRQNDPFRAAEIARLVLARHDYITGKAPINEQGRKDFDSLTNQLKKDGIYLYNSNQFKNPIFKETIADSQAVINTVSKKPDNLTAIQGSNQNPVNRAISKNCYEFVAGILEDNGIAYYGNNGVGSALLKKARSLGIRQNSFLTGEGITSLLCDNPVQVHVPQVTDNSFSEIWEKIEPYLKKGAILSFSSQHFGHTGIIENDAGEWTYINSSGSAGNNKKYRVLKEDLKHEIHSRLQRAKREQTFLSITLGSVNHDLAVRFGTSAQTAKNGLKGIDLSLVT